MLPDRAKLAGSGGNGARAARGGPGPGSGEPEVLREARAHRSLTGIR